MELQTEKVGRSRKKIMEIGREFHYHINNNRITNYEFMIFSLTDFVSGSLLQKSLASSARLTFNTQCRQPYRNGIPSHSTYRPQQWHIDQTTSCQTKINPFNQPKEMCGFGCHQKRFISFLYSLWGVCARARALMAVRLRSSCSTDRTEWLQNLWPKNIECGCSCKESVRSRA